MNTMDWIFIGKVILVWFVPGAILFRYCLWRHFQDVDDLTIGDLFIYLVPSLVPGLNLVIILFGLIITLGPIIYNKLSNVVIYKKK